MTQGVDGVRGENSGAVSCDECACHDADADLAVRSVLVSKLPSSSYQILILGQSYLAQYFLHMGDFSAALLLLLIDLETYIAFVQQTAGSMVLGGNQLQATRIVSVCLYFVFASYFPTSAYYPCDRWQELC